MRRLRGIRVLGVRGGALAVAVLAPLGGSVNGIAQDTGSAAALLPPYTMGYRTETSSLMFPCREVPVTPDDGLVSDPALGQVGIATAAEAEDCTSLAHDTSEIWSLGQAPDSLVGQPARVTVVFVPDSFHANGEGGATIGGSVFLTVAGAEEWTLRSFECSAGSCRNDGPRAQDGQLVLDGSVAALPAQIEGQFRAEAFVTDGTGRARVSLSGRLVSISFAAAGPGDAGASARDGT